MPQGSFSAQVSDWVTKTKARQEAVFKESTQRVIEIMQTPVSAGGNMHVDTGFLRASLVASLGEPGASIAYKPDGSTKVSWDSSAVALVIADAQVTDKISAVYTANYAIPREYGARGQPPDAFVRLASQQWSQIVAEVASEAQSRAG